MMRATMLLLIFIAASGAEAATSARAKPPTPSQGCEWAGPGFVKIDGSDTCVKVGGSVRVDLSAVPSASYGVMRWK